MASEFDPYAADLYISPLRINALQLNELYKELLSVGFKSQEALFLVGQVLVSGVMTPYEDFYMEDERDEQEFNDDDGDADFF
jgi:hypothetical protein